MLPAPTTATPNFATGLNLQPQGQPFNPNPAPATPNPQHVQGVVLDEPSRQKLDGIVQKMTTNGETPQYIQNVVNDFKLKYGAPAIPALPDRNIAQKAIGTFLDPIINTGVRSGQAIGDLALTGINKISGGALDKYTPEGNLASALTRAENTPSRVPVLGTEIKPVSTITPENIVGNAISTVALGAKGVTTAGALFGAGGALQEDKGVGDVAINTVVGAIGGKILEHGFGAVAPYVAKAADKYGQPFIEKIAQYVPEAAKDMFKAITDKVSSTLPKVPELPVPISNAINKGNQMLNTAVESPFTAVKNKLTITPERQAQSIDSLENDYYKWGGATKSGAKNIAKTDARTEALNNAGTTGKAPQRVLAESGIIPKTEGTKFSTANQASDIRASVQPLNDALSQAAREVDFATQPIPVSSLQTSAIARIRQLRMPEGDRASLINNVKDEFALLREKYGDTVSARDMQLEKPNYWAGTKFDSTRPFKSDSYYQVGKSLQQGIEDMATKAGFEDVAQLNRVIGDKLEAAKYLESLNGQTLKYGKLGKYVFMGIGASLGHGIVGKVFGALGGEALGEVLMKADIANPVKRLILNSIKESSPEAYQATLTWLKQQGIEQAGRLALPPGAIQLGATPSVSSVKSVPAQKLLPTANPKTGRMQKTYSSQ